MEKDIRSMKAMVYQITAIFMLPLIFSACDKPASSWDSKQYRAAATALYQQELYREAAAMYEKYLYSSAIPKEDVPKVLYQMGNIHLENLDNPQQALGYYTMLKALYPENAFQNQLGKKIVVCLERSGRSLDAKQALTNLTEISPVTADTLGGSRVVAEIEDRKITLNEIEQAVGSLPDAPLERSQLVSQYVAQILIAEAANRKGISDRPEVKKRLQFARNQILAQENLKEELVISKPSENDLKYYFEARKEHYLQGADSTADFKKLLPKISRDWQMEKQNEKYQEYVSKLLSSDKVKLYGAESGK